MLYYQREREQSPVVLTITITSPDGDRFVEKRRESDGWRRDDPDLFVLDWDDIRWSGERLQDRTPGGILADAVSMLQAWVEDGDEGYHDAAWVMNQIAGAMFLTPPTLED